MDAPIVNFFTFNINLRNRFCALQFFEILAEEVTRTLRRNSTITPVECLSSVRENINRTLQVETNLEYQQRMRTLLRNRTTQLYLAATSGWTSSMDFAFDFLEPGRASKFVHDSKLEEYELDVILSFNNSRYDVVVPVDVSENTQ